MEILTSNTALVIFGGNFHDKSLVGISFIGMSN